MKTFDSQLTYKSGYLIVSKIERNGVLLVVGINSLTDEVIIRQTLANCTPLHEEEMMEEMVIHADLIPQLAKLFTSMSEKWKEKLKKYINEIEDNQN